MIQLGIKVFTEGVGLASHTIGQSHLSNMRLAIKVPVLFALEKFKKHSKNHPKDLLKISYSNSD